MKEEIGEVKVDVPIRDLWKAMSDLRHIAPKVLPDIVEKVELLEGDGGQGSILLFKYHPHVPKVKYQKEKIVELDETVHQMGVEILEGGKMDYGFTSYTTHIKLTQVGEAVTLIEMKALYETKPDHTPADTLKASFHYIKCLENYLLNVHGNKPIEMMKEDIAQLKVGVPIKDLWKAMSSDLRHMVAKVLPDIVEEVGLLQGDGSSLGTILLFKFFPHVPKVNFQKEKIVEYDESLHRIALEVLEGGHLDHGLITRYTNVFTLTAVRETETLIEFKVLYETKPEHIHTPGETTKETLHYLKLLENYLLNKSILI